MVVITMLKVRCRTEVKEMESMLAKGKKATGFFEAEDDAGGEEVEVACGEGYC